MPCVPDLCIRRKAEPQQAKAGVEKYVPDAQIFHLILDYCCSHRILRMKGLCSRETTRRCHHRNNSVAAEKMNATMRMVHKLHPVETYSLRGAYPTRACLYVDSSFISWHISLNSQRKTIKSITARRQTETECSRCQISL